jgi:hypothetical protein
MMIAWTEPADLILGRIDCEFYQPEYVAHEQIVGRMVQADRLPILPISAIGKLKAGPFGSKLPSSLYRRSGYPLFRVQNVVPYFPDSSNLVYLDADTQKELNASEVHPGWVLISKAGRLGDACILPESFGTSNITEHVIGLEAKPGIDPYYLVAALNERFTNTQARRFGLGTIISYLGIEATRTIRIPAPPPELQRAIGNKLRKAERLRDYGWSQWKAARSALEAQLGIALRPETFTQLTTAAITGPGLKCLSTDPAIVSATVDDTLGAQYYHPRRVHARALAQASGRWTALSQLTERIGENGRRTDPQQFVGLDRIDSATGIVSEGRPSEASDGEPESGPGPLFKAEDVLFSRLRPYLNKVSIWPTGRAPATGSGELLIYRSRGQIDPYYLFFVVKSPLGLYQVIDVTSGSTHPRVDAGVVDSILIPRVKPEQEVVVGTAVREAIAAWYTVPSLIAEARSDVAAILDGSMDVGTVLEHGRKIECWLKHQERNISAREA